MLAVFSLMRYSNIAELSDSQIRKRVNSFRKPDFLFKKALLESAYINIKKSDGKKKSEPEDLYKYAQQGLEVLKAQISFFNPSIILGGNIIDNILEKTTIEWGKNLFVNSKFIKVFQLKISNRVYPIIDSYHLSAMSYGSDKSSMDKYYVHLANALKSIAKQHPDYWERRKYLPTFNQGT